MRGFGECRPDDGMSVILIYGAARECMLCRYALALPVSPAATRADRIDARATGRRHRIKSSRSDAIAVRVIDAAEFRRTRMRVAGLAARDQADAMVVRSSGARGRVECVGVRRNLRRRERNALGAAGRPQNCARDAGSAAGDARGIRVAHVALAEGRAAAQIGELDRLVGGKIRGCARAAAARHRRLGVAPRVPQQPVKRERVIVVAFGGGARRAANGAAVGPHVARRHRRADIGFDGPGRLARVGRRIEQHPGAVAAVGRRIVTQDVGAAARDLASHEIALAGGRDDTDFLGPERIEIEGCRRRVGEARAHADQESVGERRVIEVRARQRIDVGRSGRALRAVEVGDEFCQRGHHGARRAVHRTGRLALGPVDARIGNVIAGGRGRPQERIQGAGHGSPEEPRPPMALAMLPATPSSAAAAKQLQVIHEGVRRCSLLVLSVALANTGLNGVTAPR